MKQQRGYPRVTVTPKAERGLAGGHPWVYDTEVADAQPAENGALVDVISAKGRYLGTGFISLHSKIRVRILSRNANDVFDEAFYLRRLSHAWEYRKTVLSGEVSSCRIIFGEADLFPGLTVDRFGRYLVAQTLSVGIERIKPMLFPLLVKLLRDDGQQIDGLYERNDVAIRAREGLEENKGWFDLSALGLPRPDTCLTDIVENGVRYTVDVENGQKTGFFLDQRFNRQAVARLAQGRTVLDCFTHTGSFALNAAKGGVVLGAFADGALKGFASVESAPLGKAGDYRDLTCLHVSAELRGRGIGRELFARASQWARAHGGKKLYLSAHSAVETQAFYAAMGCVEAREYNEAHVASEPFDCQMEYAL